MNCFNENSIMDLLEKNKENNLNTKALMRLIPEISKRWGVNPRVAAALLAPSPSYNSATAVIPDFASIPIARRNMLSSILYTQSIAGTHFTLPFASISSTQPFLTAALSFPSVSSFSQGLFLERSDTSSSSFGYSNLGSNGLYGYYDAGFGFANKVVAFDSSYNQIMTYNRSTLDMQVLYNQSFDLTKAFCYLFDGYNIWIGISSSTASPVFTWRKIGPPANLFGTGGFYLLRYVLFRSSYYSGSQPLSVTVTNWTGSLPWN